MTAGTAIRLLDREAEAHGYDPVLLAAEVALGVLADDRRGVPHLIGTLKGRLAWPWNITVHSNTASAIVDDRAGLLDAIQRFVDEEREV